MTDCDLDISKLEPLVSNLNTGTGNIVNGITTNVITCKNMTVRNTATVGGTVRFTNTSDVTGGGSGAITVNNNLIVNGNITIDGTITVNGAITSTPNLTQSTGVSKNVITQFGSFTGYIGGVLAPNGRIYGTPWSSTSVLQIRTGLYTEPSWMLGAHFNKF